MTTSSFSETPDRRGESVKAVEKKKKTTSNPHIDMKDIWTVLKAANKVGCVLPAVCSPCIICFCNAGLASEELIRWKDKKGTKMWVELNFFLAHSEYIL